MLSLEWYLASQKEQSLIKEKYAFMNPKGTQVKFGKCRHSYERGTKTRNQMRK